MAIQDITKPMALDETLQATNQALGGVAKDTSLQATNTALSLLGKDSSLQAIVTALATIGLNTVGNLAQLTTEQKTSLVAAINELMAGKIPNSAIGVANGVAELDANGLVPASQIPDAVDEIIEGYLYNGTFYEDSAHTKPITGKTGKIYVDLSTEKTYRWGGSAYAEISASLALGETSSTAYRGDRGKTAYDHSQDASRVTSAIVEGLYKIGATAQGHISSLSAVQKSDITALGIPGQDTTYSDATQSVHGLMSANDKTKLDGISTGANKVEASDTNGNIKIDDTETQVYDDSDIQDKISTALTPISGNPISISGLKSTQLAVEPVITFEPIQAGSGTPSPENIRAISGYDKIEVLSCGKNLVCKTLSGTGIYGSSIASDSNYDMHIAPIVKGAAYYIKTVDNINWFVGFFTSMPSVGSTLIDSWIHIPNFTAPITGYVAFRSNHGYATPQCELGTSSTTYEAPNKTTDLSESLGQTVYGGSLDVRTGLFTVTHNILDLGDYDWAYHASTSADDTNRFSMYSLIPDILNNGGDVTIMPYIAACSCYALSTGNDNVSGGSSRTGYISQYGSIFVITDTRYNDGTAFKTAVTGQKVVYQLATPFTIQLTPHEIALSQGYNYISTNGTSISLAYHNGELASLGDVSQLGETVNNLLNNQTAIISASQDISYLAKEHYLKIGNIINLSCEATGTFTNGSYTNIGTIAYKPINHMWFPLINAVSGTLAGTVLLTSEGLIRALPSVSGLTKVMINLMFIANQ